MVLQRKEDGVVGWVQKQAVHSIRRQGGKRRPKAAPREGSSVAACVNVSISAETARNNFTKWKLDCVTKPACILLPFKSAVCRPSVVCKMFQVHSVNYNLLPNQAFQILILHVERLCANFWISRCAAACYLAY